MCKQLLIASAILLFSGLAHADRDSFLLGIGLGLTNSRVLEFSNENRSSDLSPSGGGNAQLKIGGVINHQHAVYYHLKNSVFSYEDLDSGSEFAAVAGLGGLGYTYFFSPTIGSPYIETTLGVASFIALERLKANSRDFPLIGGGSGNSFLIGAGYEFSNFFQAGVTYDTFFNFQGNNSENWDFTYQAITANFEFKIQL